MIQSRQETSRKAVATRMVISNHLGTVEQVALSWGEGQPALGPQLPQGSSSSTQDHQRALLAQTTNLREGEMEVQKVART